MKQQTTFFTTKIARILSCFLILLLGGGTVYGQTKQYATVTPSTANLGHYNSILGVPYVESNSSAAEVSDATNVMDGSGSNAFLKAYYTNILGLIEAEGEAWIQVKFPDGSIAAGTPAYIRIDEPVLKGVSLDLLELVGDLTGLFSKELVVLEAYNGATAGLDGNKVGSIVADIVTDENGGVYIKATPNSAYNSIRVKLRYRGGLLGLALGASIEMNVNSAYVLTGATVCTPVAFTDQGKTTGISVNLGDVVKNPSYAIDDNTSSYSEISTEALAVAATAAQNVYFPALSEPTSILKVRLGIETSTLNLELLGAYTVKVYNGNTLVQSFPLQSGLINGLDLLGILGKGGANTVSFNVTNGAYDRVEIGMFSTVGLNLAASKLRIYDVSRTSASCPEPDPTPNPLISPVCAKSTIVSSEYVDDAAYAVDDNFDSYASIRSGAGILLNLGNKSGHLEVEFQDPVPVGKTAYIRIDYDETVLKALLAGSLGNTVAGLVNGLLLGEHYFTVEAKSTTMPANNFTGSSLNNFSTTGGKMRIVQDSKGRYYIAIKSDVEYNRIRITDHTDAIITGLLAPDQYLNVYSICYENSDLICDPAFSTSYSGSGLDLDLLNLGGNGVENAHYAIDGNPNTKSAINLGVLSIGGVMEQFVDFHTLSNPEDHFSVMFSLDADAIADVSLLANIEIKAYANGVVVFSQKISEDVLGLNLLNLLKGGQVVTLRIAPGKAFDKVSISKTALVDVNALASPLYVHEVERFSADCTDPGLVIPPATEDPFNVAACATELVDFKGANFAYHAVDGNNETYARLTSGTGTLVGGNYDSFIEMGYADPVDAYTTSYIRINFEKDGVLKSLLGGSLGNLVGGLLDGLLLGDQYFTVDVKRADGTTIHTGSSKDLFATQFVKVVQDGEGRFYVAVTANEEYKSVRITHTLGSIVGLGRIATMDVYNMCHESAPEFCDQARFVSYDGAGLNLSIDVLDLAKGGVLNPHYVIDDNNSNFSTISLGAVGVGASIYQNIYFNGESKATDELRLRVKMETGATLNVDILGSYRVKLYRGGNEVYDESLQSGVINNLDLLSLLNSGAEQELIIKPGVVFDRVQFGLTSIVALTTGAPMRLYEVTRLSNECQDPTVVDPPFVDPVCIGVDGVLSHNNVDNVEKLTDGNHNSYATINSKGGVLLDGGYEGHVELGYGAADIAGGITTYIRIDTDPTLLQSLLGGSLGNLLGKVLGNVILGDHFFEVEVKDKDGNPVVSGSSSDMFSASNGAIRIVQDSEGRYYLAITPMDAYNRVRITDKTKALLLGKSNSINVYGMCYETNFDGCEFPFTTSFDGPSGLSLDVSDLGGYGVTNGYRAIDSNNTTDYSEISLGTLGLINWVEQKIQFNKDVDAGKTIELDMAIGTGIADVGVFDHMNVVAYRNGVEVYSSSLTNIAAIGNLNLLDLFNNGARNTIAFTPNVAFDEIGLRLGSLVSIAAVPGVRLYDVSVDCEIKTKGCVISNPMLTNKIKK